MISMNPEFHSRTKHIRYHYTREVINNKLIEIKRIETENNTADIFTKGLSNIKHYKCMNLMRLEKFGNNIEESKELLCAFEMHFQVKNKGIIYQLGEGVENRIKKN